MPFVALTMSSVTVLRQSDVMTAGAARYSIFMRLAASPPVVRDRFGLRDWREQEISTSIQWGSKTLELVF
jgi:hypothetical protein